ncbi:MAG: hypothetical protein JNJ76_00730 [Candidatus Competibacter sp.]|nr:hypothetical protein [Candidatus Competibacter sp.]
MNNSNEVADFLAEGDAEYRERKSGCLRRKAELAERLDAFLMENPALGYGGFDVDTDWPASRYDEVWRAAVWLSGFEARAARPKCSGCSSYYLKHVAEKATNGYIGNGSMIAAAWLSGIQVSRIPKSPNASIGVPLRAVKVASYINDGTATFRDFAIIEPRLKSLATDARAFKKRSVGQYRVCANEYWYREEGLKDRLCELVGWEAENPLLRGDHAHDVAYDAIYKMLPYCKNCGCYPAGGVAP